MIAAATQHDATWRARGARRPSAANQSFDDTSGLTNRRFNETRLGQDSEDDERQTGGFAVVNRNDFATAFQRIVDDNSSYYVMGYYSTNERRDGRFRIEVG
jgi:hypothetical protein